MHKHQWKRDLTREHKRPPRLFAICSCGEKAQAIIQYGHLHVFYTGKKKLPKEQRKKVRAIRLSDVDIGDISSGHARIVVLNNVLRLQYKT